MKSIIRIGLIICISFLLILGSWGLLIGRAASDSVFRPISEGTPEWNVTLPGGEIILVSQFERSLYQYIEVTFVDSEGVWTNVEMMLPGDTTSLSISGCGRSLNIIAEVSSILYLWDVETPSSIPCSLNSGYLPVIHK